MDTPSADRQLLSHVTELLSVPSKEVSNPGSLTAIIIQQVNIKTFTEIQKHQNYER